MSRRTHNLTQNERDAIRRAPGTPDVIASKFGVNIWTVYKIRRDGDEPAPAMTRPPAEYSNTTPYGIAQQYLNGK